MVNLAGIIIISLITTVESESGTSSSRPNLLILNNGGVNTTFSIQTWTDRPDLTLTWKYFPHGKASPMVAEGLWAAYYRRNYEYDWKESTRLVSTSYLPFVNFRVGSTRLLGKPGNLRMNLFGGKEFTGRMVSYNANRPAVNIRTRSLVIVGAEGELSAQLYTLEYYKGASFCIQGPEGSFYTYLEDVEEIGLQSTSIKSFKFGCDAGVMVKVINAGSGNSSSLSRSRKVYTICKTSESGEFLEEVEH